MERKIHNPAVDVLIAALNEENGIGPTIEEMTTCLKNARLLVVDGWSTDRTTEIAKDMGADLLLQDGFGKGQALAQGIKHLNSDSRYIVFTDADFTYPAEYVPKMVEVLEQNPEVGMVIGNRFDTNFSYGKAINNLFYLGNRILALTQQLVNGIKLSDPLSGLRVVRREILEDWNPKSRHFDVEAEMNYYVERKGYRIVEIPIKYRPRLGEKKLKLRHGIIIFKRILAESIS